MYISKYLKIQDLVCPHVFNKYGENAWQFLDEKLLITDDFIYEELGPLSINNWFEEGLYDERGLRCILCPIVQGYIKKGQLYLSAHMTGQANDFDVEGFSASKVRLWLAASQSILPYPIRLEKDVKWVHLDTRRSDKGKVYIFNP
jgi:hypothetical protein